MNELLYVIMSYYLMITILLFWMSGNKSVRYKYLIYLILFFIPFVINFINMLEMLRDWLYSQPYKLVLLSSMFVLVFGVIISIVYMSITRRVVKVLLVDILFIELLVMILTIYIIFTLPI